MLSQASYDEYHALIKKKKSLKKKEKSLSQEKKDRLKVLSGKVKILTADLLAKNPYSEEALVSLEADYKAKGNELKVADRILRIEFRKIFKKEFLPKLIEPKRLRLTKEQLENRLTDMRLASPEAIITEGTPEFELYNKLQRNYKATLKPPKRKPKPKKGKGITPPTPK